MKPLLILMFIILMSSAVSAVVVSEFVTAQEQEVILIDDAFLADQAKQAQIQREANSDRVCFGKSCTITATTMNKNVENLGGYIPFNEYVTAEWTEQGYRISFNNISFTLLPIYEVNGSNITKSSVERSVSNSRIDELTFSGRSKTQWGMNITNVLGNELSRQEMNRFTALTFELIDLENVTIDDFSQDVDSIHIKGIRIGFEDLARNATVSIKRTKIEVRDFKNLDFDPIIEINITSEGDDASDTSGDGGFPGFSNSSDTCYAGTSFRPNNRFAYCGMRFPGIEIPSNSGIGYAYISGKVNFGNSNVMNLTICAETGVDSPEPYTSTDSPVDRIVNFSSNCRTWEGISQGFQSVYNTPDISALIQKVIDDPVWNSGDPIALYIFTNASQNNAADEMLTIASAESAVADSEPVLNIFFNSLDVVDCATLYASNVVYRLAQNLTCGSNGLTINVLGGGNNFVIDGGGYNLSYAQTGNGDGIRTGTGFYTNFTIRNFGRIENLADPTNVVASRALDFSSGTKVNFTIHNNTIITQGSSSVENQNYGLYISDGNDDSLGLVQNNTFITQGGRLIFGIRLNGEDTRVVGNNFTSSGTSFSTPAASIGFTSSANDNLVADNFMDCSGEASAIYMSATEFNNITGNNFSCSSNQAAIYLDRNVEDNIFANNTVLHTGSGQSFVVLRQITTAPANNVFYNNFVNLTNADIVTFDGTVSGNNNFSTTPFSAINIIGGDMIAGNFYANASGDGYSEVCTDGDSNGICDNPLVFQADNAVDYYPLTYVSGVGPVGPPECAVSSTNSTEIDCSANLQCNTDINLQSNPLILIGTGTFNVNGVITNIDYLQAPYGCFVQGAGALEYE